jgi:hypothetical protein
VSAFVHTVEFDATLLLAAFALSIFGAVFSGRLLLAMFRRGAVKRYLRQRGCAPIKVRWLILAWGCPWIPVSPSVWVLATAFRVIYSEPNRLIHKAYCWVGYDVGVVVAPIFSGFSRRIEWVKDEIIGELPSTEPRVSDEIAINKLDENPQTDNSPGQ